MAFVLSRYDAEYHNKVFPAQRWRTDESWDTTPYSHHVYAYALGNPVNYSDPTGKYAEAIPPICPLGYERLFKDGRFDGCKEIENLPAWAEPFKGSMPIMPGPSTVGTGTAGQLGGRALGEAVKQGLNQLGRAAGWCLAAVGIGAGEYSKTQDEVNTQTRTRSRSSATYVADSNIFMDRIEGGAARRYWIDTNILRNPNITLYVPNAARTEVLANDRFGTQATRLRGYAGGATIINTVDGDLSRSSIPGNLGPVDVIGLQSRAFDENDMKIVRRAQELTIPLLTTNGTLYSQIFQSNIPQRKDEFGSVMIVVPLGR